MGLNGGFSCSVGKKTSVFTRTGELTQSFCVLKASGDVSLDSWFPADSNFSVTQKGWGRAVSMFLFILNYYFTGLEVPGKEPLRQAPHLAWGADVQRRREKQQRPGPQRSLVWPPVLARQRAIFSGELMRGGSPVVREWTLESNP